MGTVKIEGAIDLHCHYGPDMVGVFDGMTHSVTAVEAAQEAAESGHAALVLKAHDFATPALAHALEQVVPGIRIFGGITLDHQAGGLNPAAVESALRLGAKIVWLPTLASVQDYQSGLARELGFPAPGIAILDESGKLLGRHGGVHHFTVGQRHGLGIGDANRRLYVQRIDAATAYIGLTETAEDWAISAMFGRIFGI